METLDIPQVLQKKKMQLIFKRAFDILASASGIAILGLPMLACCTWIYFDSPGPVFFRQERIGKNGKPFRILKFRTMVIDAEKKGMQITVGDDKRITEAGRFLRKTKMDELPQLINVLIGQMSLVGPRPEVLRYVKLYTPEQRQVLLVRPGITDLASIKYRNENEVLSRSLDPEKTYIEDIMPEKLRLNKEYICRMSVLNDMRLIFKTIFKVASKEPLYSKVGSAK